MTTEAKTKRPTFTEAEIAEFQAQRDADDADSREKMKPARIAESEELRLEALFFDSYRFDDMSGIDVTLKNGGPRIQYFPSVDKKNRNLSVRGSAAHITIGRWRDLSASSPWVLEGAFAHFSSYDENGNYVEDLSGPDAVPLIEAEFTRLFSPGEVQPEL